MTKMAQFDKHKRVFCNSEVIAKELLAKNLATPGFMCCLCCVVGYAREIIKLCCYIMDIVKWGYHVKMYPCYHRHYDIPQPYSVVLTS